MDYRITCGSPADLATPCIITAVFEDSGLSDSAKQLDQAADGHLSSIVDMGDIQGKAGQSLILHRVPGIAADRVLLVGCGKSEELSAASFSKAITTAVSALKSSGADAAVSCLDELEIAHRGSYWKTRFTIEAAEGALYRYSETKSGDQDEDKLQSLSILVAEDYKNAAEKGLQHGQAIALGSNWAKTLGNLPGNICTPTYLAEEVRAMSENYDAMSVEVLEEEEMEELGMGALLSVSRGSVQPAKLIVMQYRGGAEDEKPVVLVGKGLTFDAGGISIKPAAGMDEMKYDMMGGGSVIGTMKACAEMGLPMNVTAVVPSSENLPDADANKPGDIVTTMSGQTVEVLNTDAEGRLILCDALTYSQRFEPKLIIDVATLTGACIIALGHKATGLMANDQDLADDILKAGRDADDRAWQLPIWDDYQEQLDSNFADIANIGGRPAGSITAACFLSRFTKENRWAHLDIAGTAWNSGGKAKGATGRPVPLLSQILLNQCDKD